MSSHRLVDSITKALRRADQNARKLMNSELINSNWEVGKLIVEAEAQNSNLDQDLHLLADALFAVYGLKLDALDLKLYKQFYKQHPIAQKISHELSWAHYLVLLQVSDDLARAFYQWQAVKEQWEVRELKTHIQMALFEKFKKERKQNIIFAEPKLRHMELEQTEDIHLLKFFSRFHRQIGTS